MLVSRKSILILYTKTSSGQADHDLQLELPDVWLPTAGDILSVSSVWRRNVTQFKPHPASLEQN